LEINLIGDEFVVIHLTQNEYEDSLIAQARENAYNMLYQTDQQGYNLRSRQVLAKPTPQKDKSVVSVVQPSNKNPERKKVQLAIKVAAPEENKFSSPFSLEHEISKIKFLFL
jgi:hypothetical protein